MKAATQRLQRDKPSIKSSSCTDDAFDKNGYGEVHEILIFKGAVACSFKCFGTTVALVYYCTSFKRFTLRGPPRRRPEYVGRKDIQEKHGIPSAPVVLRKSDFIFSFRFVKHRHPLKHFICALGSCYV